MESLMSIKTLLLSLPLFLSGCAASTSIPWQNTLTYTELQNETKTRIIKAINAPSKATVFPHYSLGNLTLATVLNGSKATRYAVLLDEKSATSIKLPNPALYNQFRQSLSQPPSLSPDIVLQTSLMLGTGTAGHLTQTDIDALEPTNTHPYTPRFIPNDDVTIEYCAYPDDNTARPIPLACKIICTPDKPSITCKDLD